jgi:low affinity Fe/Cu permease
MNKIRHDSPPGRPDGDGNDGRDTGARRGRAITRLFDRFASTATRWTGSPYAFGCAVGAIVVWLILGPIFRYSDAWQLIVNTGTTIVTFLMVFLLQQSQNKDSVAMHLKLDELLSSQRAASNAMIGIENASEEELQRLAATYLALASQRQPEDASDDADEPGEEVTPAAPRRERRGEPDDDASA